MEQQKQKQEKEQTSQSMQPPVQQESKKSFDDMSVDELNSLSAEQRRDHMLQALQRRTSNS
jgi:coupling of ubiquitin conjugation to ER degradation protein 1